MTLRETTQRFKASMKVLDIGPTLIAAEIVSMSKNWEERYRAEAEDKTFKEWLKEVDPTLNEHWWVRLANAAVTLGKAVSVKLSYKSVVYLAHSVPESYRAKVQEACLNLARNQGSAVRVNQLTRIYRKINPKTKKTCVECWKCNSLQRRVDMLEKQIRNLGKEPAEICGYERDAAQ